MAATAPGFVYITFPWSNERQRLRDLSEQLYAPPRLRAARDRRLQHADRTHGATRARRRRPLQDHARLHRAHCGPAAGARLYRRTAYPHTAKVADAIIINSESLRAEVHRYLDVDPDKLHLIPEAVDHDLFRPGDPRRGPAPGSQRYGVDTPVRAVRLFAVALQELRRAAPGLRRWRDPTSDGHQLAVVGPGRDVDYVAELHALAEELGIAEDVVWVGGVPLEETVPFYRAADAFVYPSFNETFGLPILEAMACGCPVVTSDRSAMPETAGGAALLADPEDPAVAGCSPGPRVRTRGRQRCVRRGSRERRSSLVGAHGGADARGVPRGPSRRGSGCTR